MRDFSFYLGSLSSPFLCGPGGIDILRSAAASPANGQFRMPVSSPLAPFDPKNPVFLAETLGACRLLSLVLVRYDESWRLPWRKARGRLDFWCSAFWCWIHYSDVRGDVGGGNFSFIVEKFLFCSLFGFLIWIPIGGHLAFVKNFFWWIWFLMRVLMSSRTCLTPILFSKKWFCCSYVIVSQSMTMEF